MTLTHAQARAMVEAQYAATHRRLASDPEYQALKQAAHTEQTETPDTWLARNRLHLYVETHTPLAA